MYPFYDIPVALIQTFFYAVLQVLHTICVTGDNRAITITVADHIQIPFCLVLSLGPVTSGPFKWQGAACKFPLSHAFLPSFPFILSHFASVLWTAGVRSFVRCSPRSLPRSLLSSQLSRKNGETINYRVAAAAMEGERRTEEGGREAGKGTGK